VDVSSFIRQKIKLNGEFYGIGLREIRTDFFWKGKQYEKNMIIKWYGMLTSFEVSMLGKVLKRYLFNFIRGFQKKDDIRSGNNIYIYI
jgi:hypothetical protein